MRDQTRHGWNGFGWADARAWIVGAADSRQQTADDGSDSSINTSAGSILQHSHFPAPSPPCGSPCSISFVCCFSRLTHPPPPHRTSLSLSLLPPCNPLVPSPCPSSPSHPLHSLPQYLPIRKHTSPSSPGPAPAWPKAVAVAVSSSWLPTTSMGSVPLGQY